MTTKTRRGFFLATTARLGLHGRLPKDGEGHDGIEVGAGFAEAAERMGGDDTRPKPPETPAAEPEDKGGEAEAPAGDDGGEAEAPAGDDDGDEGSGEPRDKVKTSEYIKELKRQRKEDRAMIARLTNLVEKSVTPGSTNPPAADTPAPTREKPNPNDAAKYPLGVLDEQYFEDLADFKADQKVREVLDGERQTERARAETAEAERRMATLREKVSSMADKGSELFDDYAEKVVEGGMKGTWQLSEPTFMAASEAQHGEKILYALASDKAEAERVSKMNPYHQTKYVLEKDAEFAAKLKPRTKPAAGEPPQGAPAGRNSSSPIRGDTDNLNDFRKLWYKKD